MERLNGLGSRVGRVYGQPGPRTDAGTKGRGGCGVVAKGAPEGPSRTTTPREPQAWPGPDSHGAPPPHPASTLAPACPDKTGGGE